MSRLRVASAWGGARVNTGEKITQTETSPSEAEAPHIGGRQTSGDRGLFLSPLPVDSYVTQHGRRFGAEANNEYIKPEVLFVHLINFISTKGKGRFVFVEIFKFILTLFVSNNRGLNSFSLN